MRLVITPMKQARAKKIRASLVLVEIFIGYNISERGGIVKKKNLLPLEIISAKYIVKKFINSRTGGISHETIF